MIIRKNFQGEKVPCILTIGFFDGVHLGHQRIIRKVVEKARSSNIYSCVVTFDRHPSELFSSYKVKLLTCWEEKKEIFGSLGIDVIQVFTFDHDFASLSPDKFLEKLNEHFFIKEILVGNDFTFGHKRKGNVTFLKKIRSKFDFELEVVAPVKMENQKISSSVLRAWLENGKVEKVTAGMGRPPTIWGKVIPGKGRGRQIGFPTANLLPHSDKLLPPSGVYAGSCEVKNKIYEATVNVGSKPTFDDFSPGIEVYIIGFEGELYGETLKVSLVKKIRDIQAFPSPSHLARRLEQDRQETEQILKGFTLLKESQKNVRKVKDAW